MTITYIKLDMPYTDHMVLPCGGVAYYDEPRFGMNYFCAQCETIVGSADMPESCQEEEAKYETMRLLGGKGWDYFAEPDEFF
jgi:hypothetical protein